MIDSLRDDRQGELRDDLEILEEYLNGVPLPPLEFELVGVGGGESSPFGTETEIDIPFEAAIAPESEVEPEEEPPFSEPQSPQPITTSTMAEIYVSQGFIQKAIDIYAQILNDSPGNEGVIRRIDELSAMLLEQEGALGKTASPVTTDQSPTPGPDPVLQTLERWLENIRRRR